MNSSSTPSSPVMEPWNDNVGNRSSITLKTLSTSLLATFGILLAFVGVLWIIFATIKRKIRRTVAPDPLPRAVLVEVGNVIQDGQSGPVVAVHVDDVVDESDWQPSQVEDGLQQAPVEVVATSSVRTTTPLAHVLVVGD